MKNPFNTNNIPNHKQKRNPFDMSFQNNLTLNFGGLYPVFCREVIPGDTWKIQPTFGLRFMPMTFPVQTRMRAHLHFFYVKNRYLWDGWKDFIFKTENQAVNATGQPVVPEGAPFLAFNSAQFQEMFKTSGICDYLGLPTTIMGIGASKEGQFKAGSAGVCGSDVSAGYLYTDDPVGSDQPITFSCVISETAMSSGHFIVPVNLDFQYEDGYHLTVDDPNIVYTAFYSTTPDSHDQKSSAEFIAANANAIKIIYKLTNAVEWISTSLSPVATFKNIVGASGTTYYGVSFAISLPETVDINQVESIGLAFDYVTFSGYMLKTLSNTYKKQAFTSGEDYVSYNQSPIVPRDINPFEIPFGSSSQNSYDKLPKISALPFRAYEMICNSFYRDSRNNPYYLNGKPCYNKFVPTTAGGIDNEVYQLHNRNWDQDFLTTAITNPQFGPAPLVGITSTGTMTFADESGNEYTAQATFAEDGETITGFSVNSEDMPTGTLRALVDMATSGISINDLRNVNALQRYLENTMRRGLMYKDQLENHFGVKISSDIMQLPEFIGGVSKDITVNQILQTAPTDGSPLGAYAGNGYCIGEGRTLSCFCPEHGFIIGILSIAPMANYSQLVPKMFYKGVDALDYFTPEFGHIGMQPIPYREVCPVNAFAEKAADYVAFSNQPFGYQRAWYDYLSATDEVHGMFRTNLRNFLINRVFSGIPELSKEFLTVNDDQLNDIFNVQTSVDDDGRKLDKILGQVYFKAVARRPIPLYGVPRLEA